MTVIFTEFYAFTFSDLRLISRSQQQQKDESCSFFYKFLKI